MKINQNVTFPNNGASPTSIAPGKVKATETPAATSEVRLSTLTSLLPSTSADFNAARVAEIRASISAGSYQVNTAKIADGLLSTVRDLLNKPTS